MSVRTLAGLPQVVSMAGSGSWQLSAEVSSARGCGQCLVSLSSEPKEAAKQSFRLERWAC
mgnify:CR=1 FL=1